jgi:transcriptional regulator with XRE-family HTH domain
MHDLRKQPDPVDAHVGSRIRMRRRVMGLSQEALADALGLTFQQVQKYECGVNRVSASKLFGAARVLQVPVRYFFDGLPQPGQPAGEALPDEDADGRVNAFLATPEGLELARRFMMRPEGRWRRQVLELVRALTEEPQSEPEPAA